MNGTKFTKIQKTLLIIIILIIILITTLFIFTKTNNTNQKNKIAEVISFDNVKGDILSNIVKIMCEDQNGKTKFATGIYFYEKNIPIVETSGYNVLNTGIYQTCWVEFLNINNNPSYFSENAEIYETKQANIEGNIINNLDYIRLELTDPSIDLNTGELYPFPPKINSLIDTNKKSCANTKNLNEIFILEYIPKTNNILITQRPFIKISGNNNEWIEVLSQENSSNTDGIAIDNKGCLVGIVTRNHLNENNSITNLLSYEHINKFVQYKTEDEVFFNQYETQSKFKYSLSKRWIPKSSNSLESTHIEKYHKDVTLKVFDYFAQSGVYDKYLNGSIMNVNIMLMTEKDILDNNYLDFTYEIKNYETYDLLILNTQTEKYIINEYWIINKKGDVVGFEVKIPTNSKEETKNLGKYMLQEILDTVEFTIEEELDPHLYP